jgi:hypothetical protein
MASIMLHMPPSISSGTRTHARHNHSQQHCGTVLCCVPPFARHAGVLLSVAKLSPLTHARHQQQRMCCKQPAHSQLNWHQAVSCTAYMAL